MSLIFWTGKEKHHIFNEKIGEMCNTTYRNNTYWAKLAIGGALEIWVGYTDCHPTGTYKIFTPKTKKIILT